MQHFLKYDTATELYLTYDDDANMYLTTTCCDSKTEWHLNSVKCERCGKQFNHPSVLTAAEVYTAGWNLVDYFVEKEPMTRWISMWTGIPEEKIEVTVSKS